MDENEVYKIHESIEGQVRSIEVGRSVSSLSNGEGFGKCFSCARAWIIRTSRENDARIQCQVGEVTMSHDVVECNRYQKKGEVDIWDLIKMHNPVDLSKPDKVMGFSKHDDKGAETDKL
jgi:hypothetical protein